MRINRGRIAAASAAALALICTFGEGAAFASSIEFQQPQMSGINGSLCTPKATHISPPLGRFVMVFWQKNPLSGSGLMVPTEWPAGSLTGFTPETPATSQMGFAKKAGTSTAQMEGDVVGAYLNSSDMVEGEKMMITPQYKFPKGASPVPFINADSVLNSTLNLQVPVAVGENTYVTADLLFVDPSGARISFGVKLFSNGHPKPVSGYGYDRPSKTFMLNTPLVAGENYLTKTAGSAIYTAEPWLGWRQFGLSISRDQFRAALDYLSAKFPNQLRYTDPAQYVLAEVHLNAEFHFQKSEPAELGWSMTNWKVWLTG